MREEVVDEAIYEAIIEGARAGVFRRAARLNPSAAVWDELADVHSSRAATLLNDALGRHSEAVSRPKAR